MINTRKVQLLLFDWTKKVKENYNILSEYKSMSNSFEMLPSDKRTEKTPTTRPVMVLAGMKGRLPFYSMTKSGYLVSST